VPIDGDGGLVLASSDPTASLTLAAIDAVGDCHATLRHGTHLLARRKVVDVNAGFMPMYLSSFLAGLDTDWRGWEGVRRWHSMSHEVALDCTHDGVGRVTCLVSLRGMYGRHDWDASATIALDPGALGDLARDAAEWESAWRE
jgi:hypothetical protein